MTNRQNRVCIWCLKKGRKSIEHIVPEVLGCPPGFVLKRGEVCSHCNLIILSPLDAVLGESFDMLRVWNRVRGKKGKLPKITGRTNLRGNAPRKGPIVLHINLGEMPIESDSFGAIPATNGTCNDVHGSIEQNGQILRSHMKTTIGGHPDFSRALHKIAFEWFVKLTSWENALDPKFNPIRDYVCLDVGYREIILLYPETLGYRHEFLNRFYTDSNGYPCLDFVLCGIHFIVSLGPDQRTIDALKLEAARYLGASGWTYLPLGVNKLIH